MSFQRIREGPDQSGTEKEEEVDAVKSQQRDNERDDDAERERERERVVELDEHGALE